MCEVKKELGRIEKLLNDEKSWDASEVSIKAYKAFESQNNSLLQVEEIVWRQRTCAVGLKYGNRNSVFSRKRKPKEES